MAQQKKKKTGKKKTGSTQTPARQKNDHRNQEIRTEVLEWILFLFLILILLGIFIGDGMGVVGSFIHEIFIGLLGLGAYFASVVSVVAMGWYMFSPKTFPHRRFLSGSGLILILSIFLHLLYGKTEGNFKTFYAQASYRNGGAIGGLIGNFLRSGIGFVGSIVILCGLALILCIILTQRSAVKGIAKAGDKAKEQAQRIYRKSEDSAKRRTERRAARQAETAKGKSKDDSYDIVIRDHSASEANPDRESGRRPIQDGQVDIPLLDRDTYSEKKKRHQAQEGRRVNEPIPFPKTPAADSAFAASATDTVAERVYEPLVDEQLTLETQEADFESPNETFESTDSLPMSETNSNGKARESANAATQTAATEVTVSVTSENPYRFPSIDLLSKPKNANPNGSKADLLQNAKILEDSLMSFGVEAKVVQVNRGPAVTRYELQPKQGVKVSKIVNLADDIALNLAAVAIRIEAPIPGKSAVGIEVPNKETSSVVLREVIESSVFQRASSKLTFALGKNVDGEIQVGDIAKMPHLLIAGATGSGKSVCINSMIISLLYKADPKDVRMILIDPKVVELSVYNGIPHLLLPVVNDPKKAVAALNWAVQEMTTRYKKFADMNVRDLAGYNEAVRDLDEGEPLPQIVIIIDELADLMMVASKEVEESICRLAQMARAAGLHLVIATQRPSVDVITGLIKANIPSRLAFAVSSGVDSRTILDMVGAEKLLGKGDMLFCPIGASKPTRIQGAFVSDKEVEAIVEAVRTCPAPVSTTQETLLDSLDNHFGMAPPEGEDTDELLEEAIRCVVEKQKASISMLQRLFRIGFNRAARLMDAMEERGVVGPDEGSKPRKVLMTPEEYNSND